MAIKLVKYLLVVILFWSCNFRNSDRKIDTRLSLAADNKSAFGGYVFQYFFKKTFEDNSLQINKRPFDKWYKAQQNSTEDYSSNKQVYCIAAPRFNTWKNEAEAIADFVDRGNTMLIASDFFEPDFLDLFSIKSGSAANGFEKLASFKMRDTYKFTVDSNGVNSPKYGFFFYPFLKKLESDSSLKSQVIGQSDFNLPDIVRVKYGNGELILVTNATALSNYFLLSGENYKYAQNLLSYLPEDADAVFWDDFYRRLPYRQSQDKSMLSALFAIPQLRWALIILLIISFIWIFTNLFRKQRVIPVIKPNKNSSLEFTQTIARLYFNKKDNKNIANKMIIFFNDWLRNKYYMSHQNYNDVFVNTFASKSKIPTDTIQQLANTIYTVQHNATVEDSTLLDLNNQLQYVFSKA